MTHDIAGNHLARLKIPNTDLLTANRCQVLRIARESDHHRIAWSAQPLNQLAAGNIPQGDTTARIVAIDRGSQKLSIARKRQPVGVPVSHFWHRESLGN